MSKYTLEGYLEKTGAKGPLKDRFQKRWFSVKQGETQVQYFSTKDSKKAAGAIDLTQVRLVIKPLEVADEIDRRKSARGSAIANGSIFEVHTLDRIYRLKAISPEDADNWIRNLKLIIDDIRPSKQPPLPLGSELISDVEKQRLATFPSQTSSTLLRSSNFPPTPTKMAPQPISFSSALSSLPTVMLSTNEQLHSEISSSTASSRNEHNSVPISTTDVLKPPNFLDLMDDDDDGEKGESNENHSPPEPTRSRLLGSSPIAHVTHNPNESPLLHSQATVADPRCVVPPLDYHPQMMEITEPDVDEQSCNRSGDSRSSHTLSSSPLTFGTSLQPSPLVENMRINVGERETPGIPLQEHQNGPSSLLDLTTADSQKQKQLICQLESQLSRLKRSFDEKESHHQIVLQNLKKENLRLLQENQSSQKDCISGSLQIELSKSKQDGSNLSTESVSRDQEIESTRERLAASESFASQKNQEVLELERELQVLKSQRSTILNENSSLLNAQIDSLKEKNCRLEEQLQLLVDQEQKISNFSDTLGKKDESISYMQHQISDLKQQIQYCSERLSQSESKTQFLLQEKASLETQLKSTVKTDSNASTSANLISPAFAVSPSLSENEKRLKELEEVVSHLKETNSKLLSQLNSERASKAILSSQLLALQAASQKRGNQTERDKDEEGHSSAKESEGGLRNMMKELKSSRIQIATQNEEIESMKLKIKELEALISILEESKADSDDDLLTKSSHSYPYQQQQQQQTQMQMQTQMQNNLKSVERVTTYAPKHSSSSSSLAVEQTLKIAGGDCKFGYLNDDDETVLQRIISLEKTVSLYRNKYEQLEIEIELLRNNLLLNNQKNAELASDNRIKDDQIVALMENQRASQKPKDPTEVERALRKCKEAIRALQVLNTDLTSDVQRMDKQVIFLKQNLQEKINFTNEQLCSTRLEYLNFRHQVYSQNRLDARLLEEHRDLQEQFFFSLAVGLKLSMANQGINLNIDVQDLYEKASASVPYKQWESWLVNTFQNLSDNLPPPPPSTNSVRFTNDKPQRTQSSRIKSSGSPVSRTSSSPTAPRLSAPRSSSVPTVNQQSKQSKR